MNNTSNNNDEERDSEDILDDNENQRHERRKTRSLFSFQNVPQYLTTVDESSNTMSRENSPGAEYARQIMEDAQSLSTDGRTSIIVFKPNYKLNSNILLDMEKD